MRDLDFLPLVLVAIWFVGVLLVGLGAWLDLRLTRRTQREVERLLEALQQKRPRDSAGANRD